MAQLEIRAVADFIGAERHLSRAIALWPQRERVSWPLLRRSLGTAVSDPGDFTDAETCVAMETALTALAALEVALRTSIYYFDDRKPPLPVILVRLFAAAAAPWLASHGAAVDFLLRYAREAVPQPDELIDVSFGEISGILELADDLINNSDIQGVLLTLEHKRRRNFGLGALSTVFGSYSALYKVLVGGRSDRGMVEFVEFTLNLDTLKSVRPEGAIKIQRGLMDCFGAIYRRYSKTLKRAHQFKLPRDAHYWNIFQGVVSEYARYQGRSANQDDLTWLAAWSESAWRGPPPPV
jgi:hypothetical protein